MANELLPGGVKRPAAWKMVVNLLILVLVVGVFGWQLHKEWPQIVGYQWSLHWGLAGTALFLLLICSLLDNLIWNRTLGWFLEPLPFHQLVPVFMWSYMGRYIPGKVGSLVLRVVLAAEVGRAPVPTLAASAVELALRLASALLLFLCTLASWGALIHDKTFSKLSLSAFIIIPVILICAHPRVMLPVMNWGLKLLKKPPIERKLRYRDIMGVLLAEMARWLIYGLAFWLLVLAVYPAAATHVVELLGTAVVSWAAGFVLASPGGLGWSEWVIKTLLEQSLAFPTAVAFILPVLMRLWTLAAEGAWALAAIPLWRMRKVAVATAEVEEVTHG